MKEYLRQYYAQTKTKLKSRHIYNNVTQQQSHTYLHIVQYQYLDLGRSVNLTQAISFVVTFQSGKLFNL